MLKQNHYQGQRLCELETKQILPCSIAGVNSLVFRFLPRDCSRNVWTWRGVRRLNTFRHLGREPPKTTLQCTLPKKKKPGKQKSPHQKKKTKKEINLENLRHFHYLLNLFGLNSKAWKVHLIPAKIIEETNTHSSKIRKMNLSHISWKIRYLSTVIMKFKVLGSSGSFWTPKPEPPAQPFAGARSPPNTLCHTWFPNPCPPSGAGDVIYGVWMNGQSWELPLGAEPQPRSPLLAVTSGHFLVLHNDSASQRGTISYNFVISSCDIKMLKDCTLSSNFPSKTWTVLKNSTWASTSETSLFHKLKTDPVSLFHQCSDLLQATTTQD